MASDQPHDFKLAVVKDGTNSKGQRYMGVRYCRNCKLAEPALGIFYRVPDHAEIFSRKDIDIRTGGTMPQYCASATM